MIYPIGWQDTPVRNPAPLTALERADLCRDLARAVGNHPDCPERERRAAVRRIHEYTDRIARLQRKR